MLGGTAGTAGRALGLGFILGGMLIAASPQIAVGVAITYLGVAIFVAGLIQPVFENSLAYLGRIVTNYVGDVWQARKIERAHGKASKERYLSIGKESQNETA